ncbi:L-threonine 3-dehydrogenase [Litorimonas taeanensis]|uniref:L-threonine 3-dehydrogenase n=2 Tax=Litorimonas taeanensis TaxID=568099 RepID=A0A420WJU7_9PROT|nr:L-threonine 3-dehydrogenase [Litorimonas taeanensis]RKQ71301.1 L-threonine 3-dehydrogenase [Litorimonas taeanensis]
MTQLPKTMKALVKAKSEKGLWMQDVPVPEIAPNEVLIEIERTAICGTDMHIYRWDEWAQNTVPVPMVVGHEYGGRVAAIGSTVTRVAVGDRVSGEGHVVGRRSRNARAGRFHLDPDTKGIGVNLPGAFAQYLALPEFNVIPLRSDFPLEIAAILDPLGNAVHTALAFDLVGEDVLITGAGPIGIMAAAVAERAGARRIVLTDINDWRLDFAKTLTTRTRMVNTTVENLRDVMDEIGMEEGFDVGLEMSGAQPAFDQMLDNMLMGGNIAMLGIPAKPFPVDFGKLVGKALTLRGIYGRQMYETWYKMLAMIDSGLDMNPLITHRFKATDFQKAFDLMETGKTGKVILDWTDL